MKRLTSFLLAMVMVFGILFLASCGKKSVAKTEYDENGNIKNTKFTMPAE